MSRLKKEKSYTSTPPLGFNGLLQGDLHFYFTFPFSVIMDTTHCLETMIKICQSTGGVIPYPAVQQRIIGLLTLEDETDMLSRKFGDQLST